MKTRFLFPHKWRIAGYLLFIIGLVIMKFDNGSIMDPQNRTHFFSEENREYILNLIKNDAYILSIIIGLLLVAFSKEKIEDEQISQVRLDSLQWAIYVNYGVLIISTIFFNNMDYLAVMGYNMVTPLLFFIIRFRWIIYRTNRLLPKEEIILS